MVKYRGHGEVPETQNKQFIQLKLSMLQQPGKKLYCLAILADLLTVLRFVYPRQSGLQNMRSACCLIGIFTVTFINYCQIYSLFSQLFHF